MVRLVPGIMLPVRRQAETGDRDAKREFDTLTILKETLEKGKSARSAVLNDIQIELAQTFASFKEGN